MRRPWGRHCQPLVMVLMFSGACATTVACHACWSVSVVFTHLFYVPIICAATWWRRRGVLAAVLLAGVLLASRWLSAGADGLAPDALRSLLFVSVACVVALLSEQVAAAKQDLRRLSAELSTAEERQRRQIASDLHDGVCQKLVAAKFKLGAPPADGRLEANHRELETLLDETIQDTRNLTFELCPPMLYEFGLTPALEWLAWRVEEAHGQTVEFEQAGVAAPLDDDVCVLLFRGAQELLHNVVKHAHAGRARLAVRWEAKRVLLTVADDGVGLDPDSGSRPASTGGFGLFNLRERLAHVGGALTVSSRGPGAEVSLAVPTLALATTRRRSA